MQIIDSTGQAYAKKLGYKSYDPFDKEQNIAIGTAYLNDMYKKYKNMTHALMAYNWGPGNVDKYLSGKIKTIPEETRNYIKKILNINI